MIVEAEKFPSLLCAPWRLRRAVCSPVPTCTSETGGAGGAGTSQPRSEALRPGVQTSDCRRRWASRLLQRTDGGPFLDGLDMAPLHQWGQSSLLSLQTPKLTSPETPSQTLRNVSPAIWSTLSPFTLTNRIICHRRKHGTSPFCSPPFPQTFLEASSTMPKPEFCLVPFSHSGKVTITLFCNHLLSCPGLLLEFHALQSILPAT